MPDKHPTSFKQSIAVTLLVLFTYNIMFSYLSLWLWKVYVNEQLEELATNLSNEELDEIILSYTGTIEHELNHNGVMYDVIRYEITANAIRYFCIKDFTENILSSTIDDELTNRSLLAKKQWTGQAKQLQKSTALKYLPLSPFPLLLTTTKVHKFSVSKDSLKAIQLAVSSPPPDDWLI